MFAPYEDDLIMHPFYAKKQVGSTVKSLSKVYILRRLLYIWDKTVIMYNIKTTIFTQRTMLLRNNTGGRWHE